MRRDRMCCLAIMGGSGRADGDLRLCRELAECLFTILNRTLVGNSQMKSLVALFLAFFSITTAHAEVSIYSIPFKTIAGKESSLAPYKKRVLLLVNSASECGYTSQYEGLEKLYKELEPKGLTVVAFPSNSFEQELKSDEEVAKFCKIKYGVTFPLSTRVSVAGKEIHPLFKFLIQNAPEKGALKWNFEKFLVDRAGKVVGRYRSETKPVELESAIRKLL